MKNQIQQVFEPVRASEALKESTKAFIHQKSCEKQRLSFGWVKKAAVCALFLMVLGVAGGWYFLKMPVSYISVDVNPSVELALNRLDRVTQVKGTNEDGEQLVEQVPVLGKNGVEAVELLIQNSPSEALGQDDTPTVTVASNHGEKLLEELEQSQVIQSYPVRCCQAEVSTVEEAQQEGISFGKYRVYLELKEYDPNITPEECQNMSMRQLNDLLEQYGGESSNPAGGNHKGPGNGQGYQWGWRR
ncbi:MAG: anti-sigma-I factor RsgI family protein [Massiliimalia sp.]